MDNNETLKEFYNSLKGYKISVVGKNDTIPYMGLVGKVIDGTWLKLVPFSTEPIQKKFDELAKNVGAQSPPIIPVISTTYKRIENIDNIVILDKPDDIYGKNSSKD